MQSLCNTRCIVSSENSNETFNLIKYTRMYNIKRRPNMLCDILINHSKKKIIINFD